MCQVQARPAHFRSRPSWGQTPTVTPSHPKNACWFSEEVMPHHAQLRAYVRALFPSMRDVDDVLQESYLRLWRIQAGESVRSAKGFLFQIARCVARDAARRHRRSPIVAVADLARFEVPSHGWCGAEAACRSEEFAMLAEAIDALPPRCREIMILRKLQRMPQKEIAAKLGISEQTVQVQVLKGKKRCADFFAQRRAGRPSYALRVA